MRIAIFIACAVILAGCDKPRSDQAQTSQAPTNNEVPQPQIKSDKRQVSKKSYDGPFGIDMGISIATLQSDLGYKELSSETPNYYTGSPPRPVDGLKDYFAIATEGHGVCRTGASEDIGVVNGSGDQLKAAADKLAAALEVKYGKPKKYDFSNEDVYVRNPHYWTLGLKEDAVFYGYTWASAKSKEPLPHNLESIEVTTSATSLNTGYVSVRYTFNNFKGCGEDMKKKKAANL